MTHHWHPWRHMEERYPHVTICTAYILPNGVRGLVEGNRIWLCRTLTQAERRSVLSHEIAHLERGIVHAARSSLHTRREERIVDEIAARRLMPMPILVDALKWTRHLTELADTMWTTERMVQCRLNTLDPIEVAELEHQLDGDWE